MLRERPDGEITWAVEVEGKREGERGGIALSSLGASVCAHLPSACMRKVPAYRVAKNSISQEKYTKTFFCKYEYLHYCTE